MSKITITNSIYRLQREIAEITKKLSQESKKESDCGKRISQLLNSISKNTSPSQLRTKLSEINRRQNEISRIQNAKAGLQRKEAELTARLHRYKTDLEKEEERERTRLVDAERKREREQLRFQRTLKHELENQRLLARQTESVSLYTRVSEVQYDLFVSHASEDKDDFVRPLANALKSLGVKVWYDEFTLKVGDSLSRSIDRGLANARFGTVVLSSSFFSKNWPQYEFSGMVAKEMGGQKMILPIWHKVSKDEVMQFSPPLADKVALNSSTNSIDEIAAQLAEVVLD